MPKFRRRHFSATDLKGSRKRLKETIRIIKLGKDETDCLKFKWKATQNGSSIDNNIYEYCYRRGLVRVNGKERF